ncbi:MAG: prepilin-type N-terminal cleavage/methylation domain-containing protein [Pirellulaceae bacterium]|nr:prepilin-type N-terminal cleavage/methylation domain-containing protein [Pirellulaceae bacterium]
MPTARRHGGRVGRSRGLTLVEVLMVVLVMSVVAAMLIPQVGTDNTDKLLGAAEVLAAELENARGLAIANDTHYRITFDPAGNRLYLEHSGANSAFDPLPPSPFRRYDDPATRQTTVLSELPFPAPFVVLQTVVSAPSANPTTTIEFSPLGNTMSRQETFIWLGCGSGSTARYLSVKVAPATGLVEINSPLAALPTGTGLVTN